MAVVQAQRTARGPMDGAVNVLPNVTRIGPKHGTIRMMV